MFKNTTRGLFRFLMSLFLVLQIFLGYIGSGVVAHAQTVKGPLNTNASTPANIPAYVGHNVDTSISNYLCTPDDANLGVSLYTCISKLYRFGIAFGAIALVFFLVFAGYSYLVGGETGKEKGKSIFLSALTGMVIILSSYVLLGFINPTLTVIRPIQPPIFNAADLPSCEDVGLGVTCTLPDGQVSTGNSAGGPGSGKCDTETGANGLVCKIGCARADKVSCEKKYDADIAAASTKWKVDQNIIRAMIQLESTWREGSTSHAGAKGIMQILDGTWKSNSCTGDPYKASDSINCGTKYIRYVFDILKKYGTPENVRWMAAAYNSGPGLKNSYSKSSVCSGRLNYECPFKDSTKSSCKISHPQESINEGLGVEGFYNQYAGGACK